MPKPDAESPETFAEVLDDVLLSLDEAAQLYEYLSEREWDMLAKLLKQKADSVRDAAWLNMSASMPDIDRARGRTEAYQAISELRQSLKAALRDPIIPENR